jgi:hypothetical protein
MYFVVYCLSHPYHENSDAWILDVYPDEDTAKELVENLNKAVDSYLTRIHKLAFDSYLTRAHLGFIDGFAAYHNERKMTNDEIILFKSLHSRSLEKPCDDELILEYRFEKLN